MTGIKEWFQQVYPRYPETSRRILSTYCFECFIEICGWRDEKHPDWSSLSIGCLSNHHTSWRDSWTGRISIAIAALRGRTVADLDFQGKEDVDAFIEHVKAVRDETWPA